MNESVLETIIICGTILSAIGMIGGAIALNVWRHETGRDALEKGKRELEYKKLQHDQTLKLGAPK